MAEDVIEVWNSDAGPRLVPLSDIGGHVTLINLKNVLFVDPETTVEASKQTGNLETPFAALGPALAASAPGGTIMVCPPGFIDGVPVPVTKSVTIYGFGRSLANTPDAYRYFRIPIPPLAVNIEGGGYVCLVDVECQRNEEGLLRVAEVTCETSSVVQLCNALASVIFDGPPGAVIVLDSGVWGMESISVSNGDLLRGPLSLHVDGSYTVTEDIPMNAHKFTGMSDGVDGQDSVTVSQVATAITNAIESIPTSPVILAMADVDLTTTGVTTIDTRPATPAGPGRWKLMEITLRVKDALDSGSSVVRVGSTSGGQQIVLDQTILPSSSVGDIVGGFALPSLGMSMSQVTGFESIFPASQSIYAGVTATGGPTAGVVTAYLLWMVLP